MKFTSRPELHSRLMHSGGAAAAWLLVALGTGACGSTPGPELGTRAAVDAPVHSAAEAGAQALGTQGSDARALLTAASSVAPSAAPVVPSRADTDQQAPWVLTCGDGVLDPGETCDFGDTLEGRGCSADCCLEDFFGLVCQDGWSTRKTPCHCGDGFIAPGEQCDDGNLDFGDGCDGYCESEAGTCADGALDAGEGCDDGNHKPYDGCDPGCQPELACSFVFTVDGGAAAVCGNASVEAGEMCDDGNELAGDGCAPDCHLECGNGVIDDGEMCDDGNLEPRDGCDSACRLERHSIIL